jgi:hypothetical protein
VTRSRFGIALSAALGVAAAALAGSALHVTSHPGITPRADKDVLFANFIPQFGLTGGRPPSTVDQIASVTVFNQNALGQGQSVRVTSVSVQKTSTVGEVNPWRIGPGEDCTGATIAPQGYCVVTLTFHPEPIPLDTGISGELTLTLGDTTVFSQEVSTTSEPAFEEPPVSPRQFDYGNVNVGTTTAPQTVTVSADGSVTQVMSVLPVPQPQQPDAAGDYRVATDNCTNNPLNPFVGTCAIGITATPAAAGNRPALLDIAVCDPDQFPLSDPANHTGNRVPPPAVPPGQALICGQDVNPPQEPILAKHILVTLTANGMPPTVPNPAFTPTLTAFPVVAPAGRTTLVTGTGFPDNTTVTLALVPLGTPTTTNLATVPGSISTATNGIGGFANQLILIMPHTPPGRYEIMGTTATANATVGFLVAPGIQEPPKFVTRH